MVSTRSLLTYGWSRLLSLGSWLLGGEQKKDVAPCVVSVSHSYFLDQTTLSYNQPVGPSPLEIHVFSDGEINQSKKNYMNCTLFGSWSPMSSLAPKTELREVTRVLGGGEGGGERVGVCRGWEY